MIQGVMQLETYIDTDVVHVGLASSLFLLQGVNFKLTSILHVPRHFDRKSLLIIPESSTTTSCS